jgi:hypothetical protein
MFYGHSVYFMAIRCILWSFGIFLWLFAVFCVHLVYFYGYSLHFAVIWYIFSGSGMMSQKNLANLLDQGFEHGCLAGTGCGK